MEDKWILVLYAIVAHLYLALSLMPRYYDPLRRKGPRFSTLFGPLGVPLAFGAAISLELVDSWATLPFWAKMVAGVGLGAATATVIIALRIVGAIRSTKSA